MAVKLSIDFETASTVDLRKLGAAAYAANPDTKILCMAWAFDDDPVQIWLPYQTPFPSAAIDHVAAGGMVGGWSLQFEFWIWNQNRLLAKLPRLQPEQLDDTQARAAYYGLPLALEDAGAVLHLPIQKDKAGHGVMLRMARPRDTSPLRWWHEEDQAKYEQLKAYCIRDVESERLISARLPPLPPTEHAVWLVDFKANARGITVDVSLAEQLRQLAVVAKRQLDRKMYVVTERAVNSTNSTASLLAYVNCRGGALPDLRRNTLVEAFAGPPLPPHVHEVLELRQAAAKTSVAKLPVLIEASVDGVIRGLLAYYGANRTGRWAGRLVQPQNLPRGVLKAREVDQALAAIAAGAEPDDLEMLFGKPALDVIIALIRSCLVARPGKRLVVADCAQIEARVIAWLAGQTDVLDVFERGEDVYTHTASKIGSDNRQLGKVLTLACGFGQGHVKFQDTAKGYGLDLTIDQCERAVKTWRQANSKIVQLWWDYDRAVRLIAGSPSCPPQRVGNVVFKRSGSRKSLMVIHLPSGRELFYHDIGFDAEGGIVYSGVHQTTKRWETIRTYGGKLAENVTQALARDVMRDVILDLPANLDLLLTVHDELVTESASDQAIAGLDALLSRMRTTPGWAAGLPVGAAGWVGERYKKG